jgi:hypothetical protein
LQGNFDEKASHQSFLEALMEFRQNGAHQGDAAAGAASEEVRHSRSDTADSKRRKSVRFSDETMDNEGKSTYKKKKESPTEKTISSKNRQAPEGQQQTQKGEEKMFFYGGAVEWEPRTEGAESLLGAHYNK